MSMTLPWFGFAFQPPGGLKSLWYAGAARGAALVGEDVRVTLEGLFAVTGAGSGIGAGVARAIRNAGGEIAALDLNGDAAEATAKELSGRAHQLDVSDPDAVGKVFASLGPLRGLVNCAGISALSPLVTCSIDEWRKVISVHLDGTFLCLQAAATNMLRNGIKGTIVNTASVNATHAHRGLGAYSAAKAGIAMLTKVAALELAPSGIRVNAFAPGAVLTAMTAEAFADPEWSRVWTDANPLGRVGQPDDIADVVVFLSSNESRWVTGQTLAIDGGQSLRVEPKIFPDEAWSRESLLGQLDSSAGPV
jgi:NAD(P)-dependent dehydrogenase (short-subunit alcohol dehydrogenase family)